MKYCIRVSNGFLRIYIYIAKFQISTLRIQLYLHQEEVKIFSISFQRYGINRTEEKIAWKFQQIDF